MRIAPAFAALSLLIHAPVWADAEAAPESAIESQATEMPVLEVVGKPEEQKKIPGSVQVLNGETLESSRVFTTGEALRKASGVNVRDEEGLGLRPNIGIRGLNPTRSTKVLLLEDGIPLAYAPYGDNASYYHPPVERFDRIEILKGAGQNIYGPQTVGGVINYITPAPPEAWSGALSLTGGNRDYFNGRGSVGGAGMRLDYMRKDGDAARENTHSKLNDVNVKAVMDFGAQHALTVRTNYYSEDSQLTYSGLTDAEYANFGPRYNPFRNDEFKSNREGVSLTHAWDLGADAALLTNLYGTRFHRDWWRQASSTTDTQCGNAFRDERLAGNAVDPDSCNSVQGRLREYYTWGLEPRLRMAHGALGGGELETGLRAHFETQDRVQKNGTTPDARDGTVSESNERLSTAYSGFVQNRFDAGIVSITPALRLEHVRYQRENRLNGLSATADITELLPSLGATAELSETLMLFAGVHEGFAPPRTEDIIQQTGGTPPPGLPANSVVAIDLDSESSINYEAGVRARPTAGTTLNLTAFQSDFSRQFVVGSVAGGSLPLARGESQYRGVELQGRVDGSGLIDSSHNPFVELAYTWLPGAEQQTVFTQVLNGVPVSGSVAGNRLPYAPEQMLTATLGYANPDGVELRLESVFVGAQFADFANNATPTDGSGQFGEIGGHTVWNAAANYRFQRSGLGLFVAGKNLSDRVYVVDRTRGILPGAPRLVQAGVEYKF